MVHAGEYASLPRAKERLSLKALLAPLRTAAVHLKDRLDGALHPRRRRTARERLRALRPRSVLVICLGNVCRSPYAERLLEAHVGDVLEVRSAGFIGPGRPPPNEALEVARARGVEHGDHRSVTVTPDMMDRADAVFFFDRFNKARLAGAPGVRPERLFWLGDFDPRWERKRSIVDPWGKPPEEFERVFARIERCVDEVAGILREGG